MKRNNILTLVAVMMAMLAMVSCEETDEAVNEYPDWQPRNEAYFNHLTDSVGQLIDMGRTDWRRIKNWSLDQKEEGTPEQYIIVNVLESAPAGETQIPVYTDTVAVHYIGRLLPSQSYPLGYVFDQSYKGDYDSGVSVPRNFAIGNQYGTGLIDGFATALQHMRRGDFWRVYIPYQLAYGTAPKDRIPAYSTLIFDIRLEDFWPARYDR